MLNRFVEGGRKTESVRTALVQKPGRLWPGHDGPGLVPSGGVEIVASVGFETVDTSGSSSRLYAGNVLVCTVLKVVFGLVYC